MPCRRVVTVLGMLAFWGVIVNADDAVDIAAGRRLRVTVPGSVGLVGSLLALDDDSLTLQFEGQTRPRVFRRDEITGVAVSAGHRSRGKGALIGAGIGAGIGLAIGLASGSDDPNQFLAFSAGEKAAFGVLLLAPLGALVGLAVTPAERWQELPRDRIRQGLAPSRGRGVAVSLTFAF
jgi:hypothetical protein